MKSIVSVSRCGSTSHLSAAIQLMLMASALAGVAAGQFVPASITTINQPSSGQAVFDLVGNAYYAAPGPVTSGAAQTKPGSGTCYVATGFIGDVPEPCPDTGVVKVDPAGNEVWGTLLGGPTADIGSALAVDAGGNVLITGSTGGQFPTTARAAIPTSTTATVFAAKVSADGSKFLYSTYLPASAATSAAIAVDAQDNAYIAGKSSTGHAYVIKLSADGSTILYNAVLAGSRVDAATAITIDAAGHALVAGLTTSPNFPVTKGTLQHQLAGTQNNFLARLDPAGNILMSTYLGGSGTDTPAAIGLDGNGNIYLAGSTSSLDFPTTPGTFQPTPIVPAWNNSSAAGFVSQIATDGSALNWSSYVMSSDLGLAVGVGDTEEGNTYIAGLQVGVAEMAVTAAGDLYLGGVTGAGFPVTPSAPQICFQGSANRSNGFVAHLNSQGALVDATYLGPSLGGDVSSVSGLGPLADHAVLAVWNEPGNNASSKVQFGSGGWTAPACLSTSVLNAATQTAGNGIVAGELVTLTGFGIGPEIGVAYQPDAQGNIPLQLAGVQVFFDNEPVPVLYAQSRRINAVAPIALEGKSTTRVTVTYNDQQFGPVSSPVTFGSPGIFRLHVGQSAQAVAANQDWTLNGPSNPAARGSVVTVWATGYGPTNPACAIGGLNDPQAEPLNTGISPLLFGGGLFEALYAGSAPDLVCGVVQINFQVPTNATPGNYFFVPWVQLVQGNRTMVYQPPIGATLVIK
jgi:uncharacterized protein (TIGR03437 family)